MDDKHIEEFAEGIDNLTNLINLELNLKGNNLEYIFTNELIY